MTTDTERLRVHAAYSRRIGRHTLATAIDRAADALLAADPVATEDPWELLAGWFRWWDTTDDAPAKMPGGLHVRTAVALTIRGFPIVTD